MTYSTKCKGKITIGSTILEQNSKNDDLTKNQYHAIMHPTWEICIKCNVAEENDIVTSFPFCIGVSSIQLKLRERVNQS